MTRRGFAAAILIGALVAVVALVGGYLVLSTSQNGRPLVPAKSDAGLLVALVLPDANGTEGARVLVYYPPGTATGRVIDPLTPAVVSGASAQTLGDALTFGGGATLAEAYGALAGVAAPEWIVVDQAAWNKLAPRGLDVALPRPVDVFNGRDLVTFPAGEVALSSADTGVLLAAIHRIVAWRAAVGTRFRRATAATISRRGLRSRRAVVEPVGKAAEHMAVVLPGTLRTGDEYAVGLAGRAAGNVGAAGQDASFECR